MSDEFWMEEFLWIKFDIILESKNTLLMWVAKEKSQ